VIDSSNSVAAELAKLNTSIRQWELDYQRSPGSVQLLAVSKTKPMALIKEAFDAGQRDFGENYPDEAIAKITARPSMDCQWHYIGAIQSRKASSLAQHFDWVHSVDRLKVARKLSASREEHDTALQICLQVNIDNEASKSGLMADEVAQFADECAELPNLVLRGLMAIPKPRTHLHEQRKAFAKVRHLYESCRQNHPTLDTLSMGMSADIEAAIAEGATIVRVGTAIFGAREPKQ